MSIETITAEAKAFLGTVKKDIDDAVKHIEAFVRHHEAQNAPAEPEAPVVTPEVVQEGVQATEDTLAAATTPATETPGSALPAA